MSPSPVEPQQVVVNWQQPPNNSRLIAVVEDQELLFMISALLDA